MIGVQRVYGAIKSQSEHYGGIKANVFLFFFFFYLFSRLKHSWARCYTWPAGTIGKDKLLPVSAGRRRTGEKEGERAFVTAWMHPPQDTPTPHPLLCCVVLCCLIKRLPHNLLDVYFFSPPFLFCFFGKWQLDPVAAWICWSGKQQLKEHRGKKKNKNTHTQAEEEEEEDNGRFIFLFFLHVLVSNFVNVKLEFGSKRGQSQLGVGKGSGERTIRQELKEEIPAGLVPMDILER